MPRQRKPPEQRRHRGTKDVGEIRPRTGRVPTAPTEWAEATKKAWRDFWKSAVASVVDEKSDMPAISRLFTLYDERDKLAPMIQNAPLVKGSQGQLRLNPLCSRMEQIDAGIASLEDRFGMSPKARLSTGMQLEREVPTRTQAVSDRRHLQVVDG